jgi:hypothetical protein
MFKTQQSAIPTPLRNSLGFGLQMLFLVSAGLFLLMGQSPAWKSLVDNVAINFLAVTLEALPFMLLGRIFNRENGLLPGLHSTTDTSCLCLNRGTTRSFTAAVRPCT